jgi:hypothetical protein
MLAPCLPLKRRHGAFFVSAARAQSRETIHGVCPKDSTDSVFPIEALRAAREYQ